MYSFDEIKNTDIDIANAIEDELNRQKCHLELIASENIVSKAVMAALGSPLTNKYAEGYPGKRYYGGCEFVDVAENLAIERAKKLFGCEYVNVQPHSGAQANSAVFYAILKPGDTFLGLSLDSGGHLSHGSPVNISGMYYNALSYGLDENGYIDYEEVEKLALEHKPKLIIAGGSAYARKINFKKFREIADKVGAYFMADIAHIAGLIAAGVHESSIPYAHVSTTTTHKTLRGPRGGMILSSEAVNKELNFNKSIFPGTQGGPLMHTIASKAVAFKEALEPSFIDYQKQVVANAKALANALIERNFDLVSGGTDNHLILVDLRPKNITGKDAEQILWEGHITCNKNSIPNDTEKPMVTSGIRIGTPALTTRGLVEEDMIKVAEAMDIIISAHNKSDSEREALIEKGKSIVKELTDKYPIYQ